MNFSRPQGRGKWFGIDAAIAASQDGRPRMEEEQISFHFFVDIPVKME